MKNTIFISLSLMLIGGCATTPNIKVGKLSCNEDVELLKLNIKEVFKADSVDIYVKKLKEEMYFPKVHSPVVLIYNPTSNILDFKKLSIDCYQGFESSLAIEEQLKKEGVTIAHELIKRCDMTEYNDFIIEFLKLNDKGMPIYRFICHYDEFLK